MTPRPLHRWLGALVVLLALATPVILSVQVARSPVEPHDVVVGVAGPELVSQAIVDATRARPGDAFDARVLPASSRPRAEVAAARVDAVVVVDLRATTDLLLVPAETSVVWRDAVAQEASRVSAAYGRTLDVEPVPSARGSEVARGTPYVLVLVWVALGLALASALSLRLGPVAPTAARGVVRLVGLALAAAVTGLVVAAVSAVTVGSALWPVAVVGAATIVVVAWLVLALESVVGWLGLGLGVAVLLALSAPLTLLLEPSLLPDPWRHVLPWTPPGAALALARDAVFGSTPDPATSAAVLGAWAVVALLTLVTSRWLRPAGLGDDEPRALTAGAR